jgi:phosphatidylserine/phosphatidylglycerophosphate/cardiolipin synthase-like enzyme
MAIAELIRRVATLDAARRLGQALWSKALLGEGGNQLLWGALVESGAVDQHGKLKPAGLSRLLCKISGSDPKDETPAIVWTLPDLLSEEPGNSSYFEAAKSVIDNAKHAIWIVSPFVEAYGVGRLIEALLAALGRGVSVTIVAHDVGDLTEFSSQALEEFRRESVHMSGPLAIYSVEANGRLLVHSKIILSDTDAVIIGSANITRRGLGENLEAGVLLGGGAATQVLQKLQQLVSSSLVRRVVSPP